MSLHVPHEILLVRHPETTANVDGRMVGRGDAPFTSRGERQVAMLVARIAEFDPVRVWSSPLRRALTVAEHASIRLSVPLTVDSRLTELDFGVVEGLGPCEMAAQEIAFDFASEEAPVAAGGESRRDVRNRTAAVLEDVRTSGPRVALVTHGGVFRAALVCVLGLSPEAIWRFSIQNGSIAHVRFSAGRAALVEFCTVG